jgi:type IV pilus assembly protein PilW
VIPVISDVVNLKAQYGLDTNNDGIVDTWQDAIGNWSAANLPLQPLATSLATWQQIRAVRIAIVTRSPQFETDPVTPGPILMFHDPVTPDPLEVSMTLVGDQQHYRYKEIETIVPLRNAMWNSP